MKGRIWVRSTEIISGLNKTFFRILIRTLNYLYLLWLWTKENDLSYLSIRLSMQIVRINYQQKLSPSPWICKFLLYVGFKDVENDKSMTKAKLHKEDSVFWYNQEQGFSVQVPLFNVGLSWGSHSSKFLHWFFKL